MSTTKKPVDLAAYKANGEAQMIEQADGDPTLMPRALAELSEQEYAEVRRKATLKLDLVIMPALMIMYILNYLDRQNIAAAKLANITVDLKLSATQYQTSVSLLFVGYILMQVPSNLIVAKVRYPAVYLCLAMALWGAVSAATGAVNRYSSLVVCRFFLGFVESAFFPGALFYMSCFYTKRQFAKRVALLQCGSQSGTAFGGLLAIAILKLDGAHGIEGWRWLFIIEGVATIGLALIFAVWLPSSPQTMRALSDNERHVVVWSLRSEQKATDQADDVGGLQAFVLVLLDPKTWLLMGTLYMTFYQERCYHIVGPLALCVVANIIAVSTLSTAARYVAMMLLPPSIFAAQCITFTWVSSTMTQPSAKRAAALAFLNAFCGTANVWSSYLYTGAPRYIPAFLANLAAAVVGIGFAVVTREYLKRKNGELERGDRSARGAPTQDQVESGFRYVL
ncbi:hypothetical protein MNV49_005218 [Pseudohyphozyma bogoriensis]|nr:hypothetical protein MNV49_005218 [Pseudohyphozyma bogoriensis]